MVIEQGVCDQGGNVRPGQCEAFWDNVRGPGPRHHQNIQPNNVDEEIGRAGLGGARCDRVRWGDCNLVIEIT